MARRFTMEMDKVKVPLVLVENIGDHLLFAVVHQVVAGCLLTGRFPAGSRSISRYVRGR